MKNIALAAAFSLASTGAFAGGLSDPIIEPVVIEQQTTSAGGGFIVPLMLLLVIAVAATS